MNLAEIHYIPSITRYDIFYDIFIRKQHLHKERGSRFGQSRPSCRFSKATDNSVRSSRTSNFYPNFPQTEDMGKPERYDFRKGISLQLRITLNKLTASSFLLFTLPASGHRFVP